MPQPSLAASAGVLRSSATWARTTRALGGLVLLLLVVAAGLGIGPGTVPAPAAAQTDADADETVGGNIRDAEREPIEGVGFFVSDPDGGDVGTAESDVEGAWRVGLPGPGDYTVTIDVETLPEEVELRDPERTVLEISVNSGQNANVVFATGEGAGATAFSVRAGQAFLQGIRFGLIIAMTAVGLSLIFGTTGLINFAHGDMVTFGAVIAWYLNATGPQLPLIFAACLATVVGGLLGGLFERGLWRPLRRRKAGLFQMLIISIGLSFVLRHLILLFFGGERRRYTDYAVQQAVEIGPFRTTPRDLIIIVLSVAILVGVALLLQRTRIGKAMRAVSDNRDLAESSGIDVQRVILVVWVLGGALAGIGGVLYGTVSTVQYLMGFQLLLLMFAGVILGGLGTAYGALLGSLAVGLVTEMSVLFFSPELKIAWALAVLIIVLLVRPQGLLGRRERLG